VGTLYREALGELAIRFDSIYKMARGEGETYILYCNTNGYVYDCIREIGVLLCNETFLHSQITLPITYLYYLMVLTVKDYEKHSIRFVHNEVSYYDSHFSNYEIKFRHCGYHP